MHESRRRSSPGPDRLGTRIAEIYAAESRRILATLVRLLGDLDQAEEALQEAFAAALTAWPRDGIPRNPRAWLVSAGRFRGIDAIRRRGKAAELVERMVREGHPAHIRAEEWEGDVVSITDGPFIEGKELIPGFTVIRADTREEAIEWVTRYREMMGMPELRMAEILM